MKSINKIIKILIGADLLFNSAAGFINPIFAVFLVESISPGSIELAGTAMAIMWVVKSIVRIPVAYFLDKKMGENDDYYSLVIGFFIHSFAYFLFVFAKTPAHIYAIQALFGIAGAFAYTPWYGFFARHIDKRKENFEWSITNSLVGFGMAGAGFAAGIIAQNYGFTPIFIICGIMSLTGTALLLLMKNHIEVISKDGFEIKEKHSHI